MMPFELGEQILGSPGNMGRDYVLEAHMQSKVIKNNSVLAKDILVDLHSQGMQ